MAVVADNYNMLPDCQFKNRKQKLRNIRKYVENSLFFKSEVKIFIH